MIRVFVGCAPGDDIESQAVLEYSLRRHASQPVEIVWMQLSADPKSPFFSERWRTERWSTPFSGFRWAAPHLCGFEGRAVYMDSDVIVMADIAELWKQFFASGKCVIAKGGKDAWRFCVTLFDCAAVKPHIPPLAVLQNPVAHQGMIARFRSAPFVQPFQDNWNCIDGEDHTSLDDPAIKIIHYSDEATQPHLRYAVPRLEREGRKHWFDGRVKPHWRADLVALFDKLLSEAKAAGYDPSRYAVARPVDYRLASHRNYRGHRWTKDAAQ